MIRSLIAPLADRFRTPVAQLAFVLAVAGCAATGPTMWHCDVTITIEFWDDRSTDSVSGSGSGSTHEDARRAALAVACPKLGLAGEALNACQAQHNPLNDILPMAGFLSASPSFAWDCEGPG